MALKVKKRCKRCLKVLREDGTCQNEKCILYVEESQEENKDTVQEVQD